MAETGSSSLTGFAKVEAFSDAAAFLAFLASPRFRSSKWVFRGQGNAAWGLRSTLERFAAAMAQCRMIASIEADHLREFRRRAHHYAQTVPGHENLLEWLALMRHHGSPTRLLDFSKSPYVAAFFATVEAERDDAVAIWAIDARVLKRCSAAVLSGELCHRYVVLGKRCIEDATFSLNDPEVFATLIGDIDSRALIPAGGPIPAVVFPVEPQTMNERMLLQQGLFLFASSLDSGFESSLKSVLEFAPKAPGGDTLRTDDLIYKLVLHPSAHPHVLRELHRMGLSYASLTPGLDGLARSLATVSKIRATCIPPGQGPDWDFDKGL
jgi:hypothetical protein